MSLIVNDGQASATDTVSIKVQDTTAPNPIINSALDGNGNGAAAANVMPRRDWMTRPVWITRCGESWKPEAAVGPHLILMAAA